MGKDTVILLRVSDTIKQDNKAQEHACLEYCDRNNLNVLQILRSEESAYKNTMDDLQNIQTILNYAKDGLIKNLVFFKADRIGRSVSFISFFEKMNDFGIKLHSVSEGILKADTSMDMLQIVLRLFAGQTEGESASIRVKNALESYNDRTYTDDDGEEIEDFIAGSIPFGCELVDTGILRNNKKGTTVKKIKLNEKESEIVRKIFDLCLYNDYGTVKIANWLNDNGIPTKRGKKWKNVTVLGILKNPVYIGKLRYHVVEFISPKSKRIKKVDENEWKYKNTPNLRIVTNEEFEKVQSILKQRSTINNSEIVRCSENVLLNGLVRCGYCGNKLQVSSNKRKNKTKGEYRAYYYNCRQGMRDENHIRKTYPSHIIDKEFEENLSRIIEEYVLNEDKINLNFESNNNKIEENVKRELKELENNLIGKKKELENLENEVAKSLSGESDYTPKLLSRLIDNTEKNINELKSQLLSKRSELKSIEYYISEKSKRIEIFKNFNKMYNEAATLQERKNLIRTIVSSVELTKGTIDIKLYMHE